MISFERACEIAKKELQEDECVGIDQIRETDEFWICVGYHGKTRYGTSALGIRKESGECGYLAIHSPEYIETFQGAPIHEVPNEYKHFTEMR